MEQANPLQELTNEQRLEILMAVKNNVLTMDEALDLGAKIVQANKEHNNARVQALIAEARRSPKKGPKITSKDIDITERTPEYLEQRRLEAPDPRDLHRLDDVQRLSILQAVAAGQLTQDEAMKLVSEFVAVENHQSEPPTPTSPTAEAADGKKKKKSKDKGKSKDNRKSSLVQAPSPDPLPLPAVVTTNVLGAPPPSTIATMSFGDEDDEDEPAVFMERKQKKKMKMIKKERKRKKEKEQNGEGGEAKNE